MKVLCAIDGSRQSRWALDWLPHLRSSREDELVLVHAIDTTRYKHLARMDKKTRSRLVKILEFSLEAATQLLEGAELTAAKSWGQVRGKLLRGRPAEAIARVAKRERADLLVVGSRGVTEFQPMLLGSVSRKLLEQAPCPVLLIKRPSKSPKHIVLGADGSIESWTTIALLRTWASQGRPRVTVATVVPPIPLESLRVPARAIAICDQVQGVLRREAQKLATRMASTLRKSGFPARGIVLAGSPGAELVKLADCERADLIVVGSRGGRNPREYYLGSTADAVAKYAPCSVLVTRG
jgi:nucleotide-binding universal stress UspA family protein